MKGLGVDVVASGFVFSGPVSGGSCRTTKFRKHRKSTRRIAGICYFGFVCLTSLYAPCSHPVLRTLALYMLQTVDRFKFLELSLDSTVLGLGVGVQGECCMLRT